MFLAPFAEMHAFSADWHSLKEIRRGKLGPWRDGKHVVGFDRRGAFLTDGRDSDSFQGAPWLPEWDGRPGFRLIPAQEIQAYFFRPSQMEVIFAGPLTFVAWNGKRALPQLVAVPESEILPGARPPLAKPFMSCDEHDLVSALHCGVEGLEFSRQSNPPMAPIPTSHFGMALPPTHLSPFRLSKPIGRIYWRMLGYHIPTRATHATAEGVIPFVDRSPGPAFPVQTLEDLQENGIRAVIHAAMADRIYRHIDKRHQKPWPADADAAPPLTFPISHRPQVHLLPSSFTVTDPLAAARIMPVLGAYPRNAVVKVVDTWPTPAMFVVQAWNASALLLPKRSWFERGSDAGVRLLLRPDQIVLTGEAPIRARFGERAKQREVLLATEAMVQTHLLPAGEAALRYDTSTPYPVYVSGKRIQGKYCLLSEFTHQRVKGTPHEELQRREDDFIERFGAPLPEGWQTMAEDLLERHGAWSKAERETWLTLEALGAVLGISADDDLGSEEARKGMAKWLDDVDWPYVTHPTDKKLLLHKPFTFAEVAARPDFPDLFARIVGERHDVVLRIMKNEAARVALLAASLVG